LELSKAKLAPMIPLPAKKAIEINNTWPPKGSKRAKHLNHKEQRAQSKKEFFVFSVFSAVKSVWT
jgi:hypothetical protein